MIPFKTLAPGSVFSFGVTNVDNFWLPDLNSYNPNLLKWIKLNRDGDCLLCTDGICVKMNIGNDNGKNATERRHGSPFYPDSQLRKWLTTDGVMTIAGSKCLGFLGAFTDKELEFIEPVERMYTVPTGYTKKHGEIIAIKDMAWLPTSEYLDEYKDCVMAAFTRLYRSIMTSSCNGSKLIADSVRYGKQNVFPDNWRCQINPVIRIKGEALINNESRISYPDRVEEVLELKDLLRMEAA